MVKYFHFHNIVSGNKFDGELKSDQCQHHINNVQCRKMCQIGLSICWIHLLSECHLRIKESTIDNAGMGLFALIKNTPNEDAQIVFREGDTICLYNGEILTLNQHLHRYEQESAPYTAELHRQNNIQMYEDASIQRGVGSLINHSVRNFNCRMSIKRNNTIAFIATKNIRNHSEILVNYGRRYRFNVAHTKSATNRKRLSI